MLKDLKAGQTVEVNGAAYKLRGFHGGTLTDGHELYTLTLETRASSEVRLAAERMASTYQAIAHLAADLARDWHQDPEAYDEAHQLLTEAPRQQDAFARAIPCSVDEWAVQLGYIQAAARALAATR